MPPAGTSVRQRLVARCRSGNKAIPRTGGSDPKTEPIMQNEPKLARFGEGQVPRRAGRSSGSKGRGPNVRNEPNSSIVDQTQTSVGATDHAKRTQSPRRCRWDGAAGGTGRGGNVQNEANWARPHPATGRKGAKQTQFSPAGRSAASLGEANVRNEPNFQPADRPDSWNRPPALGHRPCSAARLLWVGGNGATW